MIYEALFLPVTEEKEMGEAATKRSKKKRGRRMDECEERAQGEGRQASAEEASITP